MPGVDVPLFAILAILVVGDKRGAAIDLALEEGFRSVSTVLERMRAAASER